MWCMPMDDSQYQRLLGTLLQKQGLDPRGCSESDIAALEQRHHCTLPRAYVDFLRRFGHSADRVFRGEDVAYKHLQDMNGSARELAEEVGAKLAGQAFAFWSHQGEHYYFFAHPEE